MSFHTKSASAEAKHTVLLTVQVVDTEKFPQLNLQTLWAWLLDFTWLYHIKLGPGLPHIYRSDSDKDRQI